MTYEHACPEARRRHFSALSHVSVAAAAHHPAAREHHQRMAGVCARLAGDAERTHHACGSRCPHCRPDPALAVRVALHRLDAKLRGWVMSMGKPHMTAAAFRNNRRV